LNDALILDNGSDGAVFRLKLVGGGFDFDGFRNLADLQREIETYSLLHLHFDVVAGRGFEAGVFRLNPVHSGWKRRECVIARVGGDCGPGGIRTEIG